MATKILKIQRKSIFLENVITENLENTPSVTHGSPNLIREGNEVIPIGVKKDESIYDDSGMVHFFTQSGEEFKLWGVSYQYKLYQLKEGRYYNFFDSSEGDFCKTVEEILPTVNSYSVASPKLLWMSNMLLDDFLSYVPSERSWSYVVVLK